MPDIQAKTPDGVIHSFPDGTPDAVVDGAIKKYLGQPSDKVAETQAAFPVPRPAVKMQTSLAPQLVRGMTGTLSAAGGVVGGIATAPGAVTTPLGVGLGAAAGESARLGINRALFGNDEPDPASAAGLESTAKEGAIAGGSAGVMEGLSRIPIPSLSLGNTPARAASLYERGVAPSGMAAEDQEMMRENIRRAMPHVSEQMGGATIATGEGGTMRSAKVLHAAGDRLWQNTVQPVTEMYGDVQRPGEDVANAIRNSFTDTDKATKTAAVNAGDRLAELYDNRPLSVSEMSDKIRELNADKAVSRYYSMSPNEQIQAETADPSLRSKLTALGKMKEMTFDAISDSGGDKLGQQFAERRKDWGAIRQMEDQVRGTRVPTPQPLTSRLANTVRGIVSLKGSPDVYLRGNETLFNLNSPNRLIPKSLNTMSGLNLSTPDMQINPQIRGLLGSGSVITPPPEDTSFVRGVDAPVANQMRRGLRLGGGSDIITPPPEDTSEVRTVNAKPVVVRDPKTGRMKRVYTSEGR